MSVKLKDNATVEELVEAAWLGIGDVSQYVFEDNLKRSEDDVDIYSYRYLNRLMIQPDYCAYTVKQLLGFDILPEQAGILSELWVRPAPMFIASRGFGKSFMLALYSILQMALNPPAAAGGAGMKIVIAGAAFRQSKFVFDYMETMWNNARRLRSICRLGKGGSGTYVENDKLTMQIGENWAVAIPIGNGEKIRGLRANIVLADEFNSIPLNIFETVIQGFGSVASDPIEKVKQQHEKNVKQRLGIWTQEDQEIFDSRRRNQVILSGTAGYDFEHFAAYWRKYKAIIESEGDEKALAPIFGGEIPKNFNWKDYSIIRYPYDAVPEGFMDEGVIARAKATVHTGTFAKEYGAVFTKDSMGFFKRSAIEAATATEYHVGSPGWPSWCPEVFDPLTIGKRDKKYVIAIDPASEADNFSIVVLEQHIEHARIVYCWTTNKKDFAARKKAGLTSEDNFYAFAARKIRELVQVFPIDSESASIAIDGQGGGVAVIEALHDKMHLKPGELPFWPKVDPDKPADTDIEAGLHIIEIVQFARYEWVSEANHGMSRDIQDKTLLFPRFDPLSLAIAANDDLQRISAFERENPGQTLKLYDTLEDCVMEIEALKDELTSIIVTRTGTGVNSRDRWDTPEIKLSDNKKGRMRKDRYSALLMANMLARQKRVAKVQLSYDFGGLVVEAKADGESLYAQAPDNYARAMEEILGLNY